MSENVPSDFNEQSAGPIKGELVPITDGSDEQSKALVAMAGDSAQSVTNFKGTGIDRFKFISQVTGPYVIPADKFPQDGIDVKYVYCHPVTLNGKTPGEVTDAYRTVLVSTDGKAYGFVSDGVFRSAVSIFQAYNFGEITPPLRVKLGTKKTRQSYNMLMLVPV